MANRYDSRDFRSGPVRGPGMDWYPGAYWGAAPLGMAGWGWYPGPFVPVGFGIARYGADYTPREPPERSPTYGRGGHREVRQWARRYGYDIEYTVRPHSREMPRRRRRYE